MTYTRIRHKFKDIPPKERSQLVNAYKHMMYRCHNPAYKAFPQYGGRGVVVCDEWRNSKEAFINWSLTKGGYKYGLSIDRIDGDGNYEPSNCQWIPCKENNGKTKNTVFVNVDGERHSLRQWSILLGLAHTALYDFYKTNGASATIDRIRQSRLLNTRPAKRGRLLTVFGIPAIASQWAVYLGKSKHNFERYCRQHGVQATIDKIRRELRNKIAQEMNIDLKQI